MEFIQNLCQWKNTVSPVDCLSVLLAIIACVLAWFIPKRIMWEQTYASLDVDYRSLDFAIAIQGIFEFFAIDCEGDVEKIPEKYEERFLADMYDIKDKKIRTFEELKHEIRIRNCEINKKLPQLCLHYQRRLLWEFFYQLDLCARTPFIGKKRVAKDYTSTEAKLIKILYYMGKATEESEILRKNISTDARMPSEWRTKGMAQYACHLYSVLCKTKPFMQL